MGAHLNIYIVKEKYIQFSEDFGKEKLGTQKMKAEVKVHFLGRPSTAIHHQRAHILTSSMADYNSPIFDTCNIERGHR